MLINAYSKAVYNIALNFFADKDNPRFDILEAILQALGFHLSIEPIKIEIEQNETININSR